MTMTQKHKLETLHSRLARSGIAISALAMALAAAPQAALAQAATEAETEENSSEIVVTGTLLRGTEATGTQAITVGQEEIAASGAASASQLLSKIPQGGTFLTDPAIRGQDGTARSINRPTLRNLGNAAASASSTLLLLDSHRLPGMGITQTGPDLDAIPTGAIERVEIVPDGGSSIYGSDAIGGVINFITRKRFDGLQARARYGFADDFYQFDSSITAGKDWGAGSAFIAYDYVQNDSIYGRDRNWFNGLDWASTQALGVPVGNDTNCQPGNIRVGTTFYALPSLATDARNLGNRCDQNENVTLYPSQKRHSVLGRITLDDGGPVSFSLTAFYMNRKNESDGGPLRNSGGFTVRATSPFYIPVTPGNVTNETFFGDFSPVFGMSSRQGSSLETYGITPSFRFDINDKWQINAFANYGKGDASFVGEILNPAPINTAITANTFNPFNLAAAGNAATLATARDWSNYARGRNEMINSRVVVDGSAFALPGGDVKVALGGEYNYEKFDLVSRNGVTAAGISALPVNRADRRVQSLFGEINVPVIGDGNRGIFHSLSLSASGRYDHYSDFGNTFNPKFGITFEPVDWVKLRGNYGESFQAPSLNDIAGATVSNASYVVNSAGALAFFGDPDVPATAPNRDLIFFGGTIAPLLPQTAKTYSFGADIKPPFIEGLSLGATYYNVRFKNLVDSAPVGQGNLFYDNFANQYRIYTGGLPAMQAYLDQVRGFVTNPSILPTSAANLYAIIDQRRQNLAGVFTDGLDMYLRYRRETGFGAVYLDFNGNYILNFERQLSQAAPFVEITTGPEVARWRTSTTLGAEIGNLRGQATWNFAEGYPITPITYGTGLVQTDVKAFHLFNLFFEYKIPGDSGVLKDLAFTLNIDNVLDTDPPLFRSSQGFANGQTLGRVIKIGVSKAF
jgi:iron complex outermembrane recepter protein